MALIQCIECKKEISDTRDECIHCGMKIKSPPNLNYVTCSECGRKIDNSKIRAVCREKITNGDLE